LVIITIITTINIIITFNLYACRSIRVCIYIYIYIHIYIYIYIYIIWQFWKNTMNFACHKMFWLASFRSRATGLQTVQIFELCQVIYIGSTMIITVRFLLYKPNQRNIKSNACVKSWENSYRCVCWYWNFTITRSLLFIY